MRVQHASRVSAEDAALFQIPVILHMEGLIRYSDGFHDDKKIEVDDHG